MLVKAPAPVVNLMSKCFELKQSHKERYRCPSFLSIRRQRRYLGIIKTTTATGSGGNNVEKLSVLGAIDDDSTNSKVVPTSTEQIHKQSASHKISSNHAAYEDGHGGAGFFCFVLLFIYLNLNFHFRFLNSFSLTLVTTVD